MKTLVLALELNLNDGLATLVNDLEGEVLDISSEPPRQKTCGLSDA